MRSKIDDKQTEHEENNKKSTEDDFYCVCLRHNNTREKK